MLRTHGYFKIDLEELGLIHKKKIVLPIIISRWIIIVMIRNNYICFYLTADWQLTKKSTKLRILRYRIVSAVLTDVLAYWMFHQCNVCVRMHAYVSDCVLVCVCVRACMLVCACVCVFVCVCACVRAHACLCVRACVCVHAFVSVHVLGCLHCFLYNIPYTNKCNEFNFMKFCWRRQFEKPRQ